MMKKILFLAVLGLLTVSGAQAQRVTDKVDRGLVAVPSNSGGFLVSWRIFGEEYYDTKYNLYRNGTKIASGLSRSNYLDASGSASATYQVEPVVRGVAQEKSAAVKAWSEQYWQVKVQDVVNRNGEKQPNAVTNGTANNPAGYTLNDVSLADVDGDGICEFIVKRNNDKGNRYDTDNKTDFNLYECYKMDGTRLWWIDLGPNMMAGPDEQWDMIGYDWDRDGKAEVLMRGADNMIIHTATGKTINVGDMSYYAPRDEYTRQGREYLIYLNGATGEPYLGWDGGNAWTPMDFPLPRFEQGEARDVYNATGDEYAAIWGKNDTGHRSLKIYMGAPYLDGRNPSIFLGRGCYTRHKFCALDVNPATHEITQRWRWNCYDGSSAWFGNGFHNFAIADVDWDGRDEIVFGSMMIDDTGFGLSTTGYGHGDAQHCGDLDPYRWGQEQFVCLEGASVPGLAYTSATTSDVYIQTGTGGDNGRCLAGNFTNDIPGSQGRAVGGSVFSLTSDKSYSTDGDSYLAWGDLNMRIYWDGDLCDEIMNSPGVQRAVKITKWGNGRLNFYNSSGQYSPVGILNNSSKNNPSALGDILGDWREELVLRGGDNSALYVLTTNYASDYGIYTLWHDHQYRNAMAWQCVGYNQPPHPSYFLGEAEGITIAPPPLILRGRTEVANGSSIGTTADHLLISGYENQTFSVQDGASPYILTVNTPAWVQGTGSQQATSGTPKAPARTLINYTTTLTGGAFSGATRIVKQGEGTLVLPKVTEKHTGSTDIWNGTLVFDGIMESSPVWLNRHTTLVSDGGQFMGGLKADYNATIYVGGRDKVGSLTASTLNLGFGSRVVIDVDGTSFDQLQAAKLTIEAKTSDEWLDFGPKYKAPVFEFVNAGELAEGSYEIGSFDAVTGSVADLNIEGFGNDRKVSLTYSEGKLWLVVEAMRPASTVVWNGTADDSVWQQAVTQNFLCNGEATYAADGDEVVFDDSATKTTVTIKGAVSPKSVTFNNDTRPYVIEGDSIVGGAIITKNGKAKVTINNENHSGNTFINVGVLSVSLLANRSGQQYGALGDASKTITLAEGATLQANGAIITDQQLKLAGDAAVDVLSGKSIIFNKGVKGSGATLTKTGAGSMELLTGNSFGKLAIKGGTVTTNYNSGNVEDLPQTVEFQGSSSSPGVWWAANNESTNVTNKANIVVPKSKYGTVYCGFRSTYTGTLTGEGTINVYTGGVRCYFDGDWSEFAGTINACKENRQNKKSYDPIWAFRNANGLPNAKLSVSENVRVSNEGKDIEIGTLAGKGTLIGSGNWILGSNGKDFILNTEIGVTSERTDPYGGTIAKEPTKLIKRGEGRMRILTLGKLYADLTVEAGTVTFSESSLSTFVNGGRSTIVRNSGRIVGQGKFSTLTLEKGGLLIPCGSSANETIPGKIKTTLELKTVSGSVIDFLISSPTKYSSLEPSSLKLNGTVNVTLLEGYTPAVGDEFTLWTANSFSGTPTFELPELPEGLKWDTSETVQKVGVLRIVEDQTAYVLGDVNGDGKVDVSDYIGVANRILNIEQEGFNEQAADVNKDGKIDISDYIGVANIILTGSPYSSMSRAATSSSRRR